jgi:predicted secreted acid phosphatase
LPAFAGGDAVSFEVKVTGVPEGQVVLLQDGKAFGDGEPVALPASGQIAHRSWTSDGHRHWFRADVVAPDKKLLLLGNPIYANWEQGR